MHTHEHDTYTHPHASAIPKPHNRNEKMIQNNNNNNNNFQTVHENRIYSLKIFCDKDYPDKPPAIQFVSRVNLPFVSQSDGKVDKTKLPVLANWNRNNSIETVLVEIRRSVLPNPCLFISSPCISEKWHRLAIASSRSLPRARPFKATTPIPRFSSFTCRKGSR